MHQPHSSDREKDFRSFAVQPQEEIRPCPKCGQSPRILSGIIGGYYAACLGHVETRLVGTREEAIRLWNKGEFET